MSPTNADRSVNMDRRIIAAAAIFLIALLVYFLQSPTPEGVAMPGKSDSGHDPAAVTEAHAPAVQPVDGAIPGDALRSLDPSSERQLRVRILNQAGQPIPGAKVQLQRPGSRIPLGYALDSLSALQQLFSDPTLSGISDLQGWCVIHDLDDSLTAVALLCRNEGYVQSAFWVQFPTDLPQTIELAPIILQPAILLAVRVIDRQTQAALADAEVNAWGLVKGKQKSIRAQTDSHGKVSLAIAPQDLVHLNVRRTGYLRNYSKIDLQDHPPGKHEPIVVELDRGRSLTVAVKNELGQVVEGARVFVNEIYRGRTDARVVDPRGAGNEYFRGVTDSSGHLVVSGIEQDTGLQVLVEHGSQFRSIYPVRAGATVEVTLPDSTLVKWKFMTPAGEPVDGVHVAVVSTDLLGWPPAAQSVSAIDGSCAIELMAGNYVLFASNLQWAYASEAIEKFDETTGAEREFTMQPSSGLKFKALPSSDDVPSRPQAATFLQKYVQPDAFPGLPQPGWKEFRANFNADLMGTLTEGQQRLGLIPGRYKVAVRSLGGVSQTFAVELLEGEVFELEATPIPAATLSVKVVDPLGEPVPQAWVLVTPTSEASEPASFSWQRRGVSDDLGYLELEPLVPGMTRVEVGRNYSGPRVAVHLELQTGPNEATLVVDQILGRVDVVVSSALLEGAVRPTVVISRGGPETTSNSDILNIEQVGPEGLVSLTDLRAGHYRIGLKGVSELVPELEVSVEEGQTARARFDQSNSPGVLISVTDADGNAIEGATLMVVPLDPGRDRRSRWEQFLMRPGLVSLTAVKVKTSSQGQAKVAGLKESSYLVFAHKEGFQISQASLAASESAAERSVTVILYKAGSLTLTLDLVSQSGREMKVQDWPGSFQIWITPAQGPRRRLDFDSQTKTYTSKILPPGPAGILVESRPVGQAWREAIRQTVQITSGSTHKEQLRVQIEQE
jgi:hypothetical protein